MRLTAATLALSLLASPALGWIAWRYKAGRWGALAAAILAAALAAWSIAATPDAARAAWGCALGGPLACLAVIDARTFRLPDPLNALLAALGPAAVWTLQPERLLNHLAAGALAFALFVAAELLFRRLRGADGLGRGDAKLFGALGFWVGLEALPGVVVIASAAGLGYGLIAARARGRALEGADAVAFGPFLALGGWLAWLYGPLLL